MRARPHVVQSQRASGSYLVWWKRPGQVKPGTVRAFPGKTLDTSARFPRAPSPPHPQVSHLELRHRRLVPVQVDAGAAPGSKSPRSRKFKISSHAAKKKVNDVYWPRPFRNPPSSDHDMIFLRDYIVFLCVLNFFI